MTTWKPDADDSFFLHLKTKYSYCPFPAFTKWKHVFYQAKQRLNYLEVNITHTIHGTSCISTYICWIFMVIYVGKYTNRPMDPKWVTKPNKFSFRFDILFLKYLEDRLLGRRLYFESPSKSWRCRFEIGDLGPFFFWKILKFLDWVVVSKIFYFHPEPWADDPIWRAYFSNGLKPRTSGGFWNRCRPAYVWGTTKHVFCQGMTSDYSYFFWR